LSWVKEDSAQLHSQSEEPEMTMLVLTGSNPGIVVAA
jgi:hypothetical protein